MADKSEYIAYCGLYCAECLNYTGTVADLARDLRKELRSYRFEKTASALSKIPFFREFENYGQCYETLGAMVRLRCSKGCRSGGGNPGCRIRDCAVKKQLAGCWECSEFSECGKLSSLDEGHGTAHRKNLQIIAKKGTKGFLAGKKHWYLKDKQDK